MAVADDYYSPDSNPVPLPGRPMRSPGLRLGAGTTPPILEDATSPTDYGSNFPSRSSANVNTGGVKRTKSLMQKIKTMVRTRAGSIEGAAPMPSVSPGQRPGLSASQRSQSMSANLGYTRPPVGSPGWVNRDVMEEEEGEVLDDDVFVERPRAKSVYAAGRR